MKQCKSSSSDDDESHARNNFIQGDHSDDDIPLELAPYSSATADAVLEAGIIAHFSTRRAQQACFLFLKFPRVDRLIMMSFFEMTARCSPPGRNLALQQAAAVQLGSLSRRVMYCDGGSQMTFPYSITPGSPPSEEILHASRVTPATSARRGEKKAPDKSRTVISMMMTGGQVKGWGGSVADISSGYSCSLTRRSLVG